MPLKKTTLNTRLQSEFPYVLNVVVAYVCNKVTGKNEYIYGIGKDGKLPWNIPEDMAHFKAITTRTTQSQDRNIVIMGRKTWESIPDKFKPLQNRYNIVLSNDSDYRRLQHEKYSMCDNTYDNVLFTTWDEFFVNGGYLELPRTEYFIIGGETLYKKALESTYPLQIYATEIYSPYVAIDCDTYFPTFDISKYTITDVSRFNSVSNNNTTKIWYRFMTIKSLSLSQMSSCSCNPEEVAYLNLMNEILCRGQSNNDRTGVGTLSVFGAMLKYDLRDTFPISTTKRIFFRAIFEELMLYLSGKTDNAILQEKGIHVWDGNTSREFLDKRGLGHYPEGDMGQTYGFNMRHYGGKYINCKTEYPLGEYGYDQLQNVINLIKTDPYSRRIIINLWDAGTIDKAALPSCLCQYQFNVNVDKKELNLAIYLRSSDYFLANNWNTCTGALLVHLLCNLEGIDLVAGELTVFIADAHIYKSHIEQVKENLSRMPYPYPKLLVKGKKTNILDFKFEDLELLGYRTHPNIKATMAV